MMLRDYFFTKPLPGRCRTTPELYLSVSIGPLPTHHPLRSPPSSSSLSCSSWHLPWQTWQDSPCCSWLLCPLQVVSLSCLTPLVLPLSRVTHTASPHFPMAWNHEEFSRITYSLFFFLNLWCVDLTPEAPGGAGSLGLVGQACSLTGI